MEPTIRVYAVYAPVSNVIDRADEAIERIAVVE